MAKWLRKYGDEADFNARSLLIMLPTLFSQDGETPLSLLGMKRETFWDEKPYTLDSAEAKPIKKAIEVNIT